MEGKITLITPPDIFENSNKSVLFINLNEIDQDRVSQWLSEADIKENINFYVYTGESNVSWLLYALNRCEYKYIDIDAQTYITQALSGYILGKSGVSFKTKDENLAAVYSHINQNRVTEIEKFLEILLSE